MNCHRARQLISPYLDQQLTGRQMLDLQQHFSQCASCETEARSLRQLKSLLRGLHMQRPLEGFPEAIRARTVAAESAAPLWQEALLPLTRPQRGRRLTTAMAFSCLTILVIAAPFAPASRDGHTSAGLLGTPGLLGPRSLLSAAHFSSGLAFFSSASALSAAPDTDLRPAGYQSLTESDEARREQVFAARYIPVSDPAQTPLTDDAVHGYVQGDVAFAGYRIR